jgi:hypothetical protein
MPLIAGTWPGGACCCHPGGGQCTLFAGGVNPSILGTRPGGSYDCRSGGGPTHPAAGGVISPSAGPWAGPGSRTDIRAGSPCYLFAGVVSLPSAGSRPGRHHRLLPGRVRLQPDRQERVYTWDADTRPSRDSDNGDPSRAGPARCAEA